MSLSYYIYYRVAAPAQARKLVRHIQSALKSETGVNGRLLTKRDDPSMWMEIYEGVGDGGKFEQALGVIILQAADFSSALAAGSVRHMECFEDSCA